MTTFIYDNVATILLNEEVTMENSKEIVDFIYGATFLEDVDAIKVSINSPGGSVIGGLSIFTALVSSEKKVITQIDGIAASIAAVIFMAGQERKMMEYGLFMIHNPFGGDNKALDKIKDSLMKMLGEDNFNNLSELMDEETWLNADEMKGLINEVIRVENGDMKEVTNKALELFEVVNQLKQEEMENIENQESISNETLESNIEERVEELDSQEEAVEETVEEVENVTEINDGETSEEILDEVSEEVLEEVIDQVVEEEVEETEEEQSEEALEIEAEVEVSEEVVEEVQELEAVENNVEEVVNAIELTNKLKEQEEVISELKNKLGIYEKEAENKVKLDLLKNSAIKPEAYTEWLDLDVDVIERLAGTVNKISPSIDSVENKINKDWSIEEKQNLLRVDPAEYARLVREKVIK